MRNNSENILPEEAHERGHEFEEPSVAGIAAVALGLITALALFLAVLLWIYQQAATRPPRPETSNPPATARGFPLPRLQLSPPVELVRLRSNEDSILNSYGWIDQTNGLARIPINRAIEILSERGLPVLNLTNAAARKTELDLIQERRQE